MIIMKGGVVRLVIFSTILGLAVFDLYLVTVENTSSSISAWLSYVGLRSPLFCVTVGAIIGHLFPMSLTGKCPHCKLDLTKEKT